MDTPILFLIFNRPETTSQVFERIRQAQPERLYISADGPRQHVDGEKDRCMEARKIATQVDWDCTVQTLFRDENLGCRTAVSQGIDWFFKQEAAGIILEDDCLVAPDFFSFASNALKYYFDSHQVMHISAFNPVPEIDCQKYSAYFNRYAHIWGWASWRRAWRYYDEKLDNLDLQKLKQIFPDEPAVAKRWGQILSKVHDHAPGFDTWDFQWSYTIFLRNGMALTPQNNLVQNIGLDSGTHIINGAEKLEISNPAGTLAEPYSFPPPTKWDPVAAKRDFELSYQDKTVCDKIWNRLFRLIGKK